MAIGATTITKIVMYFLHPCSEVLFSSLDLLWKTAAVFFHFCRTGSYWWDELRFGNRTLAGKSCSVRNRVSRKMVVQVLNAEQSVAPNTRSSLAFPTLWDASHVQWFSTIQCREHESATSLSRFSAFSWTLQSCNSSYAVLAYSTNRK